MRWNIALDDLGLYIVLPICILILLMTIMPDCLGDMNDHIMRETELKYNCVERTVR